jgi:hypothetical protein
LTADRDTAGSFRGARSLCNVGASIGCRDCGHLVVQRSADASDDPQKESATPTELEDALPEALRHNADVPGLVQLYTRFSAEATDPQNHAHHYFAERYARLRVEVGLLLKTTQDAGRIPSSIDSSSLAAVLVAATDGLQLQWLYNPELDMAGTLGGLLDALAAERLPLR